MQKYGNFSPFVVGGIRGERERKILTGYSESSSTAIRKLLSNMRTMYLESIHHISEGTLRCFTSLGSVQPLLQCSPVILHPVVRWVKMTEKLEEIMKIMFSLH